MPHGKLEMGRDDETFGTLTVAPDGTVTPEPYEGASEDALRVLQNRARPGGLADLNKLLFRSRYRNGLWARWLEGEQS